MTSNLDISDTFTGITQPIYYSAEWVSAHATIHDVQGYPEITADSAARSFEFLINKAEKEKTELHRVINNYVTDIKGFGEGHKEDAKHELRVLFESDEDHHKELFLKLLKSDFVLNTISGAYTQKESFLPMAYVDAQTPENRSEVLATQGVLKTIYELPLAWNDNMGVDIIKEWLDEQSSTQRAAIAEANRLNGDIFKKLGINDPKKWIEESPAMSSADIEHTLTNREKELAAFQNLPKPTDTIS